ncbi:MAG: lysine--tRNA ligase [Candidatus Colwellbacteria bacterium CG10_big_fil_rev_8_21_14_0_10_42_22]|uniref:Lysine--tRNA ligase n=1 Tax=Candidatus Colwellbacteria bacterium CG10_big_fil_rev_8_21_14_0_10_42_22 TaxID=1974540 RepID=A0A2H0VFI8_9BACT|nr:MAG: lysine--tRNA ligase [Candidatus Colwellbacteria bacterium CG10_big_fil_rev_8_21_14_0_10_42_22]
MLSRILKDKFGRLEKLRKAGVNPFPARVKKHLSISSVLKDFPSLSKHQRPIYVVGRIISRRDQGKLLFIDLYDGTDKIQIFAAKKELSKFDLWKDTLDIGDFIGVKGICFKTKKGEKSIRAKSLDILAKSLRPLPDTWFGLKDVEERFRKRYLDMLMNLEVKESFDKRSKIVREMREFLWKNDFIEVETPMLQPIPGGALAEPFKTHHNALGQDFYLRIAPELYLKRLLVGGFNKVFEMGRIFRNEGMDREHNPEFTMLELYWAYQDYEGLIKFTEKLLNNVLGKKKWEKITYAEAFKKYAKKDLSKIKDKASVDDVFKREVRSKLIKPTILCDHPKAISPLAKSKIDNPEITERFQFIIGGVEIANGFSELNDPIDQKERMEYQESLFRKGNKEVTRMDKDFLEALEYGMPPAAGLGVGIDRLVVIATNRDSVKESIIFPTLKSKK